MREQRHRRGKVEIAHVLFLDIVSYSKLSSNEQRDRVEELNQVVRQSEHFRKAEAANHLLKIPSGDGMALVFYHSLEEPVECAVELSRSLKAHPALHVRMGIHSGPVTGVLDVNKRTNVAGAGINIAQRVMSCGDAGHILLSSHIAEDLQEFERWRPFLHDLDAFEVKHATKIKITNFYSDTVGNRQVPTKLRQISRRRARLRRVRLSIVALLLTAALVSLFYYLRKPSGSGMRVTSKSVAVLPFTNLSQDPDNAFFAEGMQDEILTHLAKISELKVISRTSVMQYGGGTRRNLPEIARQLGVAHVVEGSVQRVANKVRVNAQLIDARADAHLWAQSYDRELADVFVMQSEIAEAIANQLQARLSPKEKAAIEQRPTTDLAAFDFYTHARTLTATAAINASQEKDFRQAVELLTDATARDPSFHAAYCQLVFDHDWLYAHGFDHSTDRLAASEAALGRAIELRPEAAETHLARGSHLYYAYRDYNGALAELELARGDLPNDPRILELRGYMFRRQGKHEEGIAALEQAVSLDPRNVFTLTQLALSYHYLRRYADEAGVLDRTLSITPDDVTIQSERAFLELLWHADTAPLHKLVARVRAERPDALADVADNWFLCALAQRDWSAAEEALTRLGSNPFWGDGPLLLGRQFGEGLLARALNDEARAQRAFTAARGEQAQVVEKQKDYGPALCLLGLIDAALGDKQAALEEGRHAMELLPVGKDAVNGQMIASYYSVIAAWADDRELALQQLEATAFTPGGSLIASYGVLKLLPFWDPLRGDPRFERIVAELAPK